MLARIQLRRGAARPLHEQLISQLRELILEGGLTPGSRLPATRHLSTELRVSRNVVVLAYEQLRLEGYLAARVGSGTWVPESLPAHLLTPGDRAESPRTKGGPGGSPRLSDRGRRLSAPGGPPLLDRGLPCPFRPCVPAPELFPARLWSRLSARVWRSRGPEMAHYGDPRGFGPLREAIAAHVRTYRSVRCEAGQVLVTAGSQQALDLVARMLVDPGDDALVEDPGYRGAKVALSAAGARLVPAPVDGDGVNPAAAPFDRSHRPRVAYITPSHQFPLGVTLPLSRRLALLEWARETGAWIVEDDYDSEFRYRSRPLPSLQGLDDGGRVIYVGTFSKILAPGLRLGFLVLPEGLVEAFGRARTALDAHPPLPLQATLAEFISGGHMERHVGRVRSIYGERRDALQAAIEARLGGAARIEAGPAGLHLAVLLPDDLDDRAVSAAAARDGVEAPALSDFHLDGGVRRGLVLGFAPVPPEKVLPAVRVLERAVGEGYRVDPGRPLSD
jgi:GntR family transcriptional regulator / MocR family aminotransferase